MSQYRSLRPPPRHTGRRSSARLLVTVLLTTGMVATGGFGTVPDNPVTAAFQDEIGQNVPEPILDPVNSFLEELTVPTIQPQPDSATEAPLDLVGLFLDALASETPTGPEPPQTLEVTETASLTSTLTDTLTSTPALTTTATDTFTPTITPTSTATSTGTATPTSRPFTGFTVSGAVLTDDLTQSGTSITVAPGQSFYVSYNYQVSNDPCPGCLTQLVTGLGTAGSHGGACAYSGVPGAFPGVSGAENFVQLTAPVTPGTYPVVVEYHWQFTCADALAKYGSGGFAPPQTIGRVVVKAPPATAVLSPTPVPFTGFNVSAVNINGAGTSATVPAGSPFTVTYNYQVYNTPCPGCITQLVTGLSYAGSQAGGCAYDGIPGVFPGVTGAESTTLYAPSASGTYPVIVVYFWHYTCADALANYPSGVGSTLYQTIGQVIVP